MREPTTRRDQREIVVPRDMRPGNSAAKAAPHRAARTVATGSAAGEFLATVAAIGRWTGRVCTTRPGETLGSVAALVAVGYVTVNALGFQAGRHPAPILPQPAAQAPAAKAPSAPAQPAQASVEPAAKDKPEAKHAEKAPARDAIGDILRSAGDTTASVTPKPVDKVAQAQRALSKLGYGAIKADGMMGPATRAAIEKFERDRKLPVTGEASGRTLRELASKAGSAKG
ncbi:peptidoglycan-binding domain-containing protein [Methylobacterium haplocladii]|uniref:Peptidoglycan binding-like domain-containing protein n=1 Tax=Methylobacterium haplocladii TaxID=1176176 RepID=A0A512IUH8_9HYPH|nr:peptidoglycan-binding domain-containing protein [Methylobacterium haplocladii]GEP01368.1 hypothetical protein MHA02_37550 [Methylobacterium haplocladii]GJD83830.1 hypothetical protein HPGCJGGD_1703 [Methylobacterium haplocladii]GLS58259.1 hypothetical protein GCM10007887_09170 [Methylobacterium haplocladii]